MPALAPPVHASPGDVPGLLAAVFDAAPLTERKRLLELLLRPLGVLSLAAVANGLFAKFALRSNWTKVQLRAEDVQQVQADDVVALAHYVQQAGLHAFEGIPQVLSSSPALMGTTAAVVLLAFLSAEMKRRSHRAAAAEKDFDPPL